MSIAVAGAGVAGLSAAAFLARAGHRVAVYDKAPRPAPVGSGLIIQPTGQAVLAALGLTDTLNARAARLDRLDGRIAGGDRKVLDVDYAALAGGAHGCSLHRSVLFEMLYETAVKAGVLLNYGCEVVGVNEDGEAMRLRLAGDGVAMQFDLVIDALGVRTPFIDRDHCFLDYGALWANVPCPVAHGFSQNALVQRYRGAGVSAGVMPIGSLQAGGDSMAAFFWTLRADQFEAWRQAPLSRWKDEALAFWPEIAPVLDSLKTHDQFVFARYAHHTAPASVEGRIVHIGDAWHAASPQLGQGANMALLDAFALSKALEGNDGIDRALAGFLKMRHRHVQLYQTVSHLFTPVYQSDSKVLPALRDAFAQPFSALPPMRRLLASMVAGTLGDPLGRINRQAEAAGA